MNYRFNIFAVFLALSLLFCLNTFGAEDSNIQRILMIDSYSTSDTWTKNLRNSIRDFLTKNHKIVNYETYELGIRFQPGIVPASEDIETLRVKLNMTHYDLIIVSNNPAADLFLERTVSLPKKTPVLISTYNGPLSERIPPGMEITGVETPINIWDNIKLAQQLYPHLKLITILTGASSDGVMIEKLFWQGIAKRQPEGVKIQLIDGNKYSTSMMLEQVSALPSESVLLYHSWSSRKEITNENNYTILSKIRESFPGLILGHHYSDIKSGSAGGVLAAAKVQGIQAGKQALQILSGEQASKIRVEKGIPQLVLDYPQLKAHHISSSLVPPDALLLNTPPDTITQYRSELITITLCIFVSLLVVLFSLLHHRKAQNKISTMFSHLPFRIGVVDSTGKLLYTHFPKSAGPGFNKEIRNINQLPFEVREQFTTTIKQLWANGGKLGLDYQLFSQQRHADFIFLDNAVGFGKNIIMWVSTDTSALHHANTSLSKIVERFKLTLESIGDGVIATDAQSNITLINPVASKLTGYPADEAVGQPVSKIFNIISSITNKPIESPLQKALNTGEIIQLDNHTDLVSRTGARIHIADSAAPIKDNQGEISGGVLVFRDVTEDYRQRDRMRLNSVVLKNAAAIARFVYFSCNEKGEVIYSTENNESWPLKRGDSIPFSKWVSPDEYPDFIKGWNQLFSGEKREFHKIYSSISGSETDYFEIRAESVFNELNHKIEYIGVIQDITQARQNEIRYRDNLKLLESIMNYLPGYIFVKDVENDYRYVMGNNKLEEITGASLDFIIGKTDREVFTQDKAALEEFRQNDMIVVESGKMLDKRVSFTNDNGKKYVSWVVKNSISRSDGSRLLIGMGIDVTKMHELEQEQLRTIEVLNNYINTERIVNESLRSITLEDDFNTAVNKILQTIGINVGADSCYIFRYEENSSNLFSANFEWIREGYISQLDNFQNADMSPAQNLMSKLLNHEDIMIDDTSNPPECFKLEAEFMLEIGIRSIIISGIWINDELSGFVSIAFIHTQKNFTDSEIKSVNNIINLYLLALERDRRLKEIVESQQIRDQFFNSVAMPVIQFSLDYDIMAVNPMTVEITGMSEKELIGRKCYEAFCNCDAPPDWCPMRKTVESKEIAKIDYEGYGRQFIIATQPVLDSDGNVIYVLETVYDISDQKNQEHRLSTMNLLLNRAADLARITYFSGDPLGVFNIIGGNSDIGMTKSSDNDLSFKDWLIPDDQKKLENKCHELAENSNCNHVELLCHSEASGKLRSYRMVIMQENNDTRILNGVLQDITDTVAMEHEREELLENLKTYAEHERLMNSILENITINNDDDAAMQEILHTMTNHLGAFISYIFKTDFEQNQDVPIANYHVAGQNSATAPLPALPIEHDVKWFKTIRETGIFEVPLTGTPEANEIQGQWAPYMKPLGVKSLYGAGIWIDNEYWGYMVFLFDKPLEISQQNKTLLTASAHLVEIILERRRNRADLSRSEYEKRLIIDTIKIPVLLFDKNRKLLRVNNAAVAISGMPEEEIYEKPCYKSFCGNENLYHQCSVAKAFKDSQEHSMSLQLNGRDYHVSSHPIIVDGKLVNILKTFIDITETNATQKQLTEALKEAQNANKAKSYFLATMSHEIRTPLNAVIGFSILLQNDDLSKQEQLEYVQSINLAGNTLLGLINDVLDLSKLEAERMTIVPAPSDINQLLKEIFSVFQYKVKEKKIDLIWESNTKIPILKIDSARLRQVLLNLIGNAVKFTEQGKVVLQCNFIHTENEQGKLTITVKDTGIGIAPEALEKIFQPFFQQNAIRDSVIYQGTGLGLAISSRLVKNMGGTIRVESEQGVGSTFTIELPDVAIGELPVEHQLLPSPVNSSEEKPLNILIIDDVPINLKMLSAMLKKLKVKPFTANSASEALEVVKKEKIDLVLTDMWMPEVNGAELARMIHRIPGLESLQVIAVTADTEVNNSFNLSETHHILLKPISLEKLKKILSLFREGKLNGIK